MKLLPLSPFQSYLCDLLSPDNSSSDVHAGFTIASAMRITPKADVRRLGRAFDHLQRRHDCFRMSFQRSGDDWHGIVHATPQAKIEVLEFGPQSDADQNRIIQERLALRFAPEAGPLIAMDLLRFGDQGDVALFRVSHLVTDGFGWIVASEDLMHLLLGVPLLARAVSVTDYLTRFANLTPLQRERADTYWRDLITPVPPKAPLGRHAKGLATEIATGENRDTALSEHRYGLEHSKTLRAAAKSAGVTPYAWFAGAFQRSLQEWAQQPDFLATSVLARNDARLNQFAGCEIGFMELALRAENGDTTAAQARAIHQQLRNSMGHMPHAAATPGSALHQEIQARGGSISQFSLRIAGAQTRSGRKSLLDLYAGSGRKLGKYQFERLELLRRPVSMKELALLLGTDRPEIKLNIRFDTDGYTGAEIGDFTAILDRHLGL